jgi:hypothetical protein
MESGITDSARAAMVRAALARVGPEELKSALSLTADARFAGPAAVTNALKALRKHRDPTTVVDRPQYRAALPYLAAAVSDDCLARTIEVLGDHSDDPTRQQLLETLDDVRGSFSEATVLVMLASVADGDMPASDLCFELLAGDGPFALADWATFEVAAASAGPAVATRSGATPEQRQARREKKVREAEERRKKAEAARKAGEQLRRERKKERQTGSSASGAAAERRPASDVVPRVHRRAVLTPLQEEEFDRLDPLAGAVVFAWVSFDPADPEGSEGKSRRCVVIAGSADHLLVRPGYSEGGAKSRDWKSVALRHWKQAGFDRPTWIDTEAFRVPRQPEQEPVGRLAPEDWNALW